MLRRLSLARHQPLVRGFTLVELMVAVAVLAILLMLAAPSFRDMLEMQRLRGTSAQLVTDVQFSRSEAVSRQQTVVLRLTPGADSSCYVIYTCSLNNLAAAGCNCNCNSGVGNACSADPNATEIRTVVVPASSGVQVMPVTLVSPPTPPAVTDLADLEIRFDPRSGGAVYRMLLPGEIGSDISFTGDAETRLVRDGRALRTQVGPSGRPSVCSPTNQRVTDVAACL